MTDITEPLSGKAEKTLRARILTKGCYDPKTYEFDERFRSCDPDDPLSVHTTIEMLQALEKNQNIALDARVICRSRTGRYRVAPVERNRFLESFKKDSANQLKLKEVDSFATDCPTSSGRVGDDFIPLLGGPFYKNLYYYQDYIRMHSEAFYAYHHDPVGKAIVNITRDFVLGTGYEVQCDLTDRRGKVAMACWKAYEEVNDLPQQIDDIVGELSIYGEVMLWRLPNYQTKITYKLGQGEVAPTGYIPRVRLIDPSNIVEIVTYPEDISRRIMYIWLAPTQYQLYGGAQGNTPDSLGNNPIQPALKYIYQQIPANQMYHFAINKVSNEKRGRSDLFPILQYLKRLRDSVDYALIALQKTSAWSIDTAIEGSQADVDNYVSNQAAIGTIAPAGSEFVHSAAIKRSYLGNSNASAHTSDAFDWCLSMIAAGVQIPIHYFGMHLAGGQTRASAIVGTEPVAKKMEKRREVLKRIIRTHWQICMDAAGLSDVDCDIILPELITQDRSQKLKDLALCQDERWIKPERAATIAAKELQIQNYDYNSEIGDIKTQLPAIPQPLLDPGYNPVSAATPDQSPGSGSGSPANQDDEKPQLAGALTSQDRKDVKDEDRSL